MGVADGVYAWRELGIDSGKFSQALMETSANCIAAGVDDVFHGENNNAPARPPAWCLI